MPCPRPGAGEDGAQGVATAWLRPPELDGHLHGSWEQSARTQALLELPHGPTRNAAHPHGGFPQKPLPRAVCSVP